jgi:hypothetical protein
MSKQNELARIKADAEKFRARTRQFSIDVGMLPGRIFQRLPHLPDEDMQEIVSLVRDLFDDQVEAHGPH